MAVSSVSFQDTNVTMEEVFGKGDYSVAEIKKGAIVSGKLVSIQGDSVIIDLGSKSEGRIEISEFDEKPEIHSNVEAIVRHVDNEGVVFLSKRDLETKRGWEIVKEAFEKQVPVSGVVRNAREKGYDVNVEGLMMFLPHSQVGNLNSMRKGKRPGDILGQTFTFKILELNHRRKGGVISRKEFQDIQNSQQWEELQKSIRIGDIVTGKVTKHTKTGAAVLVHGIEGFLHKSNISWDRKNDDFKDKLPLDSEIQVRILEIDPDNHRLSLGLKQLLEDPWETVLQKYNVGDVVKGRVSFVANYGAFVDLGNGLEGLLHVSEMSWTRKISHAQEVVKIDQEIETKILGINVADKRISLGLRQLLVNPWDKVREELQVGMVIKGKIKDVTNFGAFVTIFDDIDGLIRKEDINWDEPSPDPRKVFKVGEEVDCKITEINLEDQKIGCSTRHLLPNPYKALRDKYPRGTILKGVVTSIVDFGIFVRFDDKYEGLVHLSAMSKEESAGHKKHFNKGDEIQVVVKSIEPETRRISLSTRDVGYAMEKMEMQQYMDRDRVVADTGHSPFASLKNLKAKK